MKHYLIILMLALAACGITKKEPLKISDVPYHFRLTKDSTIIGVWGGYYRSSSFSTRRLSGFHIFVVYSLDSMLIVPLEPYPYDSSATLQGDLKPMLGIDTNLNPEDRLFQYERSILYEMYMRPTVTIFNDYIIESPFQATKYIGTPGTNEGYATELQIDKEGNLLINYKDWILHDGKKPIDITRRLELKLTPYTFKTIDVQKFNQTKP